MFALRSISIALMVAGLALAQKTVTEPTTQAAGNPRAQVFVTAHGKTYHTDRTCMALSRATHVYEADQKAAEAHGLKECGICAHRHTGGRKSAGGGAATWATPAGGGK